MHRYLGYVALSVGLISSPLSAAAEPKPPHVFESLFEVLSQAPLQQRLDALSQLGPLDDTRIVDTLGYLVLHDGDVQLKQQAVGLLSRSKNQRAIALIHALIMHHGKSIPRLTLQALGQEQSPRAAQLLYDAAHDPSVMHSMRKMAVNQLQANYKDFVLKHSLPHLASNIWLPMLSGSVFGGYTLATVGALGRVDVATTIGAVSGAVLGGLTGYLMASHLTVEQVAAGSTLMAWGIWAGLETTVTVDKESSHELQLAMGVVGELAGLGLAWWGAHAWGLEANDWWWVNLSGLSGWMLAQGIATLAIGTHEDVDFRPAHAAALGGGLLGVASGIIFAPHMHFSLGDGFLAGMGALEGLFYGAMAPLLFKDQEGTGAAAFVGLSSGFMVGSALAQFTDYSVGEIFQLEALAIYGKALGLGIGLLGKPNWTNAALAGSVLIGNTTALLAAGLLVPSLKFKDQNWMMLPVSTLVGAWHGLAVGLILRISDYLPDDRNVGGLALTVASLAGMGGLVWSQYQDFSGLDIAMGSSGLLWGGWYAALAAYLANWHERDAIFLALGLSDAGLLLTSLLVSPAIDLDPLIIAGANIGGISIGGIAAMVTALATDKTRTLLVSAMIGSGAGLVVGGALAAWLVPKFVSTRNSSNNTQTTALMKHSGLDFQWHSLQPMVHYDGLGNVDGMTLNMVFRN